ncbi:MAG: hypothetical protein EXR27_09135 [Betaproteobacteria bacterium]|nr:hypothetical protein [Betaproteobacteria bacterium]
MALIGKHQPVSREDIGRLLLDKLPEVLSEEHGRGKVRYIAGIHASLDRDYAPLAEKFLRVIARTWKRAASRSR